MSGDAEWLLEFFCYTLDCDQSLSVLLPPCAPCCMRQTGPVAMLCGLSMCHTCSKLYTTQTTQIN
jgi:hypothetical protein